MNSSSRYKHLDYRLGQRLLELRRKVGLTQENMASLIGVTDKTVRNWEGGLSYPTETNLKKLIEIYLQNHVLPVGQEQVQASTLWTLAAESTTRHWEQFDEQWFVSLLQQETQLALVSQQKGTDPLTEPDRLSQDALSPDGSPQTSKTDWGEAPDASLFYGRTHEIAELEHWALTDRCKLIILLGMGGAGKTALSVRFSEQMAPHFERVLWRSLRNAPPFEELLADCIQILSEQQHTNTHLSIEQSILLVIKLLGKRRCLLVLDNIETVLQAGKRNGEYRDGYEAYGLLFRSIAETRHRSCLILTSRERPAEFRLWEGEQAKIRTLRVNDLELSACQQMLRGKGIFGDQKAWHDLVSHYSGNPLALKIVAEMICEIFGGDIASFLAEGVTTFHGIQRLLGLQFERLSSLEQAVLYWLAIEQDPISFAALHANFFPPVSKSELLEGVWALRQRCLLELGRNQALFLLQPVVLEYMAGQLIERISGEIVQRQPTLLVNYALLKSLAKEEIRHSQKRLFIEPILKTLLEHLGSKQLVEQQLKALLPLLRGRHVAKQGYGGGNVLNLLAHLSGQIRDLDCSHLPIWQASLRGIEAQDVCLMGADLRGSVFTEPFASVASVALSPDGTYLAVGGFNGQISVWLVADGTQVVAIQGHSKMVWSLTFSPDSTLLASGSYDGLVKLWEVRGGQHLQTLQGHRGWVRSVTFCADGSLLATSGNDGSIRVWNPHNGQCLKILCKSATIIGAIAFGPEQVLISGSDNGEINVWDVTSGHCRQIAPVHLCSSIVSLAFSSNGTWFVSGEVSGEIRVWEFASGHCMHKWQGHEVIAWAMAVGPDGVLASGGHDGAVKLWAINEEGIHCLQMLQGYGDKIWSVAFNPQGILAHGSHDGLVKVWQVSRGGTEKQCLRLLQGYLQSINSIVFSPDGTLLIGGYDNGVIRLWRIDDWQYLRSIHEHSDRVHSLVFNADGSLFASSAKTEIRVWDVKSGRCLMAFQGDSDEVWSLAFSPDGKVLASSSIDRTVKLWELSSGRHIRTLHGHASWPWLVAFSPDGTLLASGSLTGEVRLWKVSNGVCLRSWQVTSSSILALTFSVNGNTLISSSSQELVKVWDVSSGQELRSMPGRGYANWLRSVAFSLDGDLLAIGNDDQEVEVWEVNSGQIYKVLAGHASQIWSVEFSPDKRFLACGTDKGTICIWEVPTGSLLKTLRSDRPYERMDISNVTGITEAQKKSLRALGAIENA